MNDEQPRHKVRVDLEELGFAMEDAAYEHRYFLDIEPGEVIAISDWSDDDETREMLTKIDAAEPGRYLQVPRAESRDGYADVQEFIDTIGDERITRAAGRRDSGPRRISSFQRCAGTPSRRATAMVQLLEGAAGCARPRVAAAEGYESQ